MSRVEFIFSCAVKLCEVYTKLFFIAQLVEHRTGITEVMGLNPVEALIFFRLLLSSCLNWNIYCDNHSSHSS